MVVGVLWPLQINQELLFSSFSLSPRSPRLHKVKMCVWLWACRQTWGWVGGRTVASWISIQLWQSKGIKGSTEVWWPSKMVPALRFIWIDSLRYVKTGSEEKLFSPQDQRGGPLVLRQTASGVDRAPLGCFSMGKYTAVLAPPGPKSVVIMGSEPWPSQDSIPVLDILLDSSTVKRSPSSTSFLT